MDAAALAAAAATVADGAAAMTGTDAAEIEADGEAVAATAETAAGTGIGVLGGITTVRERIGVRAKSVLLKKRRRLAKHEKLVSLEKSGPSPFPGRRSLRIFRKRIGGTTRK